MPGFRHEMVAAVTRHYPFFSGCGSLANSKLLKLIAGTGADSAWCRVPGGKVLADLSDHVGRAAYYVGELDRKVTWICQKIVREGDTVFDIGANIGMVTVLLSDLVKTSGKVYSFEPNPVLAEAVVKAIEFNHFDNVKFYPIALGDEQAELELFVPEKNKGAASLVRHRSRGGCAVHRVKVEVLDQVLAAETIGAVRLIKIDVEGFEAQVLRGASRLLSEVKPDAILFELNGDRSQRFKDEPLIELLHENGYEFLGVPKTLLRMHLKKIDVEQEAEVAGHDFLAVRKGEVFEEIARRVNVVV